MNLIKSIANDNLVEANKIILEKFKNIIQKYLGESKQYISSELLSERINTNIMRLGRIQRVRKRIRRDSKGRMVVQRNTNRSSIKGYRIVGKSIRRISAVQRLRRSMQLKRSWRSSRRSKLRRSLLKRKISMRRRYSMGLR